MNVIKSIKWHSHLASGESQFPYHLLNQKAKVCIQLFSGNPKIYHIRIAASWWNKFDTPVTVLRAHLSDLCRWLLSSLQTWTAQGQLPPLWTHLPPQQWACRNLPSSRLERGVSSLSRTSVCQKKGGLFLVFSLYKKTKLHQCTIKSWTTFCQQRTRLNIVCSILKKKNHNLMNNQFICAKSTIMIVLDDNNKSLGGWFGTTKMRDIWVGDKLQTANILFADIT